jgi:phage major head subunit gpT-like protein
MKVITAPLLSTLAIAFSAAFKNGLTMADSQWSKVATMVPSNNAVNLYGWLNNIPKMREWVGDRQLNRLKTSGYSLANAKFESSIGVARTDIEDDNVGMYTPLFNELGRTANEHVDESVFALLAKGEQTVCHDGQPFFDHDHPIYAVNGDTESTAGTQSNKADGTGPAWYLLDCSRAIKPFIYQNRMDAKLTSMDTESDENVFMRDEYRHGVRARRAFGYTLPQLAYMSKMPLTAENLQAARVAMSRMVTDNNRKLNIRATLLVVPPELEGAANVIVKAETIGATSNVMRGVVDVLSTVWVEKENV